RLPRRDPHVRQEAHDPGDPALGALLPWQGRTARKARGLIRTKEKAGTPEGMPAFEFRPGSGYSQKARSSARRFSARPFAVLLDATGLDEPLPFTVMWSEAVAP